MLWALGRALEDPRVDGADPLLLLWSGEDPKSRVEPSFALRSADPEPLHQLAIRAAREHGWLGAPLAVAPVGDLVMATGDQICVDALAAADVHEAVPDLVVRFSRRAGVPPAGLHVEERIGADALDALLESDAPALPEAWRLAVRALVSVARRMFAIRYPHLRMSDVRYWPAVAELGERIFIEVSRSDTARIGGGDWLHGDVRLPEVRVGVRAR